MPLSLIHILFNFQSYEEAPRALDDGIAYSLSFRFSPYEDVRFDYNAEDGRYYKSEFGQPQLDAADGGRQYRVDNVFLLFTSIGRYPDGLLSQVNLEQGVGFYFSQGRYERVRWMKAVSYTHLMYQRAGQSNALLLTARNLIRQPVGLIC